MTLKEMRAIVRAEGVAVSYKVIFLYESARALLNTENGVAAMKIRDEFFATLQSERNE